MIHPRTLHALEFDKVTDCLAAFCRSNRARDLAKSIGPLPGKEDVATAVELYENFLVWSEHADGRAFAIETFPDIDIFLDAQSPTAHTPDTDAFWALKMVLCQARSAVGAINTTAATTNWPRLLEHVLASPLPTQLTAALQRCISDEALIRDESTPELYRLRNELRHLHQSCMRKVRDYANQYNILPWLQDEFMTLSSDRYVLPLKANFKGRIQGIIHDWSQTGETCYFEPMFLVEINNRLQELKHEERTEEQAVLTYLQGLLENERPAVRAARDILAELDMLQAKRGLAAMYDGRCISLTSSEEGINLIQASHPLLAINRRNAIATSKASPKAQEPVHPVNITLRPGEHILVITGGNAGGKTVCLKTLGLVSIMALSALPVPVAGGSHIPWFSRLDAFIGDEQSLEDNVSTFTAQIAHLAKAWKHFDKDGLVLLDEFGAGTDPAQGSALAQAVLDGLQERNTFALAATHFPALKTYALSREGVRAASVLFDPHTKKPLFRLAYDQVGASQALDVARDYGLAPEILRKAEHYLLQDGEDTNAIISRLNELATRREQELENLDREREKCRRVLDHERQKLAKAQATLHDELRQKSAELMRAWKEDKMSAKQALKEMSGLRGLLANQENRDDGQSPQDGFSVGQRVLHKVFNKQGLVTDIDERKSRVRIDMNGVSLWAAMKDLEGTECPAKAFHGGTHSPQNAANAAMTLDLRGFRADIAIQTLEQFLDKALLAGFSEVEIIHGRGTGALRKQVHACLKNFPPVAHFSLAPEDRGGDGMTMAVFR